LLKVRPPFLSALFNARQASILAGRYFDLVVNDGLNTLLLLLQAPLIACLIVLVWRDVGEPTKTLYFVLGVTAAWFGCINASREVVKEAPIYRRERMFDLNIGSYVASKITVLSLLGLVQCAILLVIVHRYIHITGNRPAVFLLLFLCSAASSALGLVISALASSQDRAVALVPLALIPQVLFSELTVPESLKSPLVLAIEKLMVVHRSYKGMLEAVAANPAWSVLAECCLVLIAFCLLLLLMTGVILRLRD
jgi:hypothetical protein